MHHRYFPHQPNNGEGSGRTKQTWSPKTAGPTLNISPITMPLLGNGADDPKPAPKQKQPRVREPRVYAWTVIVGGANPANPEVQSAIDDIRDPLSRWLQTQSSKRWGRYIGGNVWASFGNVTFASAGPEAAKIFRGFIIFGLAKYPAEESRPVLHEMAACVAHHLGQAVAEVHFANQIHIVRLEEK